MSSAPTLSNFATNTSTIAPQLLTELESKIKHPLKIVAVGDSIIYGYGDYEGGGWVERLCRRWMSPHLLPNQVSNQLSSSQQKERVVYNLGVRGDRLINVYQRLEAEFSKRGELRRQVPDLILLSVGTNDTPRVGKPEGRSITEFRDFQEQVEKLLDLANSLAPVAFIGMTPIDEEKMPFLDCLYYNQLDQYRYKEYTLQACQQRNIPYLDIFEMWISRGNAWLSQQYGDDGLHPNVQGYKNLFNDILAWEILS